MKYSERTSLLVAVLAFGLGAPRAALAVNGCTNAYLMGAYNAQVNSMNITTIVNGTSTTAPDALALGTNPSSLAGNVAGLGRYYFDGSGNILGLAANATTSNPLLGTIGTYTVNSDCTGKITLTGGRTFNVILSASGGQALFMETDAKGGGAVGYLVQTANSCVTGSATSYSFIVGGGVNGAPTTDANGNTVPGTLQNFSAIGTLNLDGGGRFSISQSAFSSSQNFNQTATGSYTLGANCVLSLTFDSTGSTGGFAAPAAVSVLLNQSNSRNMSGSAGLIMLQPVKGQTLTGQLFQQ